MAANAAREDVDYDHAKVDDGGILFNVQRAKNGILTGEVRVYGHVEIDGKHYSYDRILRVRLKRDET
jgi:hypothetical protein